MRACSILFVAAATLLSGSDAAVTAAPSQAAVAASLVFGNVAPSTRSLATRDTIDAHQRSLRGRVTDDGDDVQDVEDTDDADDFEEEGNEERAGGTDIVKWAHGLSDSDAKMVRQIAKGNSAEHTLDKFKVPFKIKNGERVYSIRNPVYARYLFWVKRQRDNPLTFGRL